MQNSKAKIVKRAFFIVISALALAGFLLADIAWPKGSTAILEAIVKLPQLNDRTAPTESAAALRIQAATRSPMDSTYIRAN